MIALTKRGLPRQRVSAGAPMQERIELHHRVDLAGHWIWTATIDDNGYGRICVGKKLLYAHRVSYEAFVGPIPDGLQIDHLCRVRSCVNPRHLEPVTPQQNTLRGWAPGARALRRDDCLRGHSYAEHGVVRCGRRICRLCQTTYMRLYKAVPYEEAMRRKMAGIPIVDLDAYFAAEQSEERAA